mgnify:CR=1 FL=1
MRERTREGSRVRRPAVSEGCEHHVDLDRQPRRRFDLGATRRADRAERQVLFEDGRHLIVLHDPINPQLALGAAITLAGVALVSLAEQRFVTARTAPAE